jgi:hypothetical protein
MSALPSAAASLRFVVILRTTARPHVFLGLTARRNSQNLVYVARGGV